MKFIFQLLKNRKLLIHAKDQYISCLNNIPQQKKEIHDQTEQLKNLMQRYSKKKIQPMYLEQLCFGIKRAGWSVTKVYSHYTFEQECFKKNFFLMNQRSRQNAKNSIGKDIYKLMNNSNFRFDCCNNLDSCQFVSIFDELQEITYHTLNTEKSESVEAAENFDKKIKEIRKKEHSIIT